MKIIEDSPKFFKHELKYHKEKAKELEQINPRSASHHAETIEWFTLIYNFVDEALKNKNQDAANKDTNKDDIFHLNPLDLQGLPEDVQKELTVTPSETQDAQLLELFKMANRSLNLNELIVASHRKHNINYKRPALTARLYRLIKDGKVFSPSKGIYELVEPDNLDWLDECVQTTNQVSVIGNIQKKFNTEK